MILFRAPQDLFHLFAFGEFVDEFVHTVTKYLFIRDNRRVVAKPVKRHVLRGYHFSLRTRGSLQFFRNTDLCELGIGNALMIELCEFVGVKFAPERRKADLIHPFASDKLITLLF